MPSGLLPSFLPWILYFLIAGSGYFSHQIAVGAALVAIFVVSRENLRKKFIVDWATLIYFAVLFILLPIYSGLSHYTLLMSNTMIACIMWASVILRRPFTLQYAREEVDPIVALTPTFKHINYIISMVWATALTVMAIDGLLQNFHIINSDILVDSIIVAPLIFAIWFTRWFPDWYQGFLFRKFSKKLENIADNPFLNGNYAPVQDELDLNNLSVVGEIPKDLHGVYMRNGPNPAFHPISYTYPIDGDGMLHAVYLQGGRQTIIIDLLRPKV